MLKFTEFSAGYFKKYFDLHPTDAIYYGIEGYDHLLNDYSDKSYKAEKIFVRESLRKLRQISTADLTEDEAIDYALLEGRLTIAHRRDLHSHRTSNQRSCRQSHQPFEPHAGADSAGHHQSKP
jgi:uncharacterized protein (DUF885 family)